METVPTFPPALIDCIANGEASLASYQGPIFGGRRLGA